VTNAESLRSALTDLETYTAQCVENGGVSPRADRGWILRAIRLTRAHRRWARQLGFPPLASHLRTPAELVRWVRSLQLNGMDEHGLALVLCHIDVVRSVELWADAVVHPLDPWWPPDPGPSFASVPAGAWDLVLGNQAEEAWMLEPVVLLRDGLALVRPGPTGPAGLSVDNVDVIRQLPTLLVAIWLERNFKWGFYARQLHELVAAAHARNQRAAKELDEWDILLRG